MSFALSWAFAFLALVPVIILLYLVKLKRREQTVSTLFFWQRVLEEQRRRAFFRKLRQPLSLLLHLLIFLLLLLALAGPRWRSDMAAGSSTVLILDTRARMQAREADDQTRFEKARRALRDRIAGARPDAQIALLTSSGEVAHPFSGDPEALQRALEAIQVTDAGGSLELAITLANSLLASRSGPTEVVVESAGSRQDNLAITRLATRRLPGNPETSEVMLEVSNFSAAPASGNVELALDGRIVDVRPFQLGPGETRLESFPAIGSPSAGARGWLTATLDTKDALPVDDQARACLGAFEPKRVLLVSRGNWFLEKLLEADRTLRFEMLSPESFQLSMTAAFDAVILDRQVPAGFDLQATRGNFLFLKEPPFPKAGPELEAPPVTDADSASPLLRLVDWREVLFAKASQLNFEPQIGVWRFQAPLKSFDHPLVLAGETADGQRLAIWAFDPNDSDLPLRVAFPLLMSNTLQWLCSQPIEPAAGLPAGKTLTLGNGEAIAGKPGADHPVAVRELFTPFVNGFYRFEDGDRPGWIAVNTFDPAESNLNSQETATATAAGISLPLSGWPLWKLLVLAGYALFLAEWFLFHRRRTE